MTEPAVTVLNRDGMFAYGNMPIFNFNFPSIKSGAH